jgi:cytochrome c oxidase subunit 3
LFTLRYELDGWYVAPTVNQWMGDVEALIMALSMVIVWTALSAIRADDRYGAARLLKVAAAVGALYLTLVIYEWSQMFVPVGTRFGENFYCTLGVSAFYTLAGLFVLTAAAMRTIRVPLGRDNYWDVQAVTWYWVFQGAAALVMYVYFYLI